MTPPPTAPRVLETSAGEFPLHECRLAVGGREWAVLHTGAVLTHAAEAHFIGELAGVLPYGVALWPASIALAHEVATRPDEFRGRSVLELGSGTGLPGIVAASLGARVVQTDRSEGAMAVCRLNGQRNAVAGVEYRTADWTAWDDTAGYDWILGSDVLYGEPLHPALRHIFGTNLAPGGRVLISDPFRGSAVRLMEGLEAAGWGVRVSKWTVGDAQPPKPVGVFELTPPKRP